MNLLKRLFPATNSIPRWVIFLIDLLLCAFSFIAATELRFNFFIDEPFLSEHLWPLPLVLGFRMLFMLYFRVYSGIIRHTGIQDALRVFYTVSMSTTMLALFNMVYLKVNPYGNLLIPISILIIDYIGAMLLMSAFRLGVKLLYMRITKPDASNQREIAIFGAGEAGIIAKRKIEQHTNGELKVIAFFDDNPKRGGSYIDGVPVYNTQKDFTNVVEKFRLAEIIISDYDINKTRKQELIESCLAYNIKVRNVPPIEKWINGELSYNQIKNVKIEDLIQRDTIVLDKGAIATQLKNKVVMVTGAAGSIGSEIVRQLIQFSPKQIILVDKSEMRLYELENELQEILNPSLIKQVRFILGDICSSDRMERIFNEFKPQIIYHAAAYKHVPLMEENPTEAIKVNVQGTRILADLSVKHEVGKFVMVSTDKAVNPTNVMGASKRIAEIYVQSLNNFLIETGSSTTRFVTTRFGNVLGSSGSVIPKFRKQIEEGGPITVTHPDITRFFMTIPEACQLVLEAGNMGKGGEIYIFDMGKSVKIIDLAKKMIKLSGLTLGQDIQIVFTGLRPGEKIKEELLADQENSLNTYHPKIMIAKVREYDFLKVASQIDELINQYPSQIDDKIVAVMKEIVPEFISQNSRFESLDFKNPKLSGKLIQ
ncbi:MAG: polysaccharide biosynthesis protein [Bacteroidia bacterium]|jgi:FlaA1/EpsC-like NDP-sugar epimerase|nr:polysaccharide biosynthesis protein [Bacteroidia bacterium]